MMSITETIINALQRQGIINIVYHEPNETDIIFRKRIFINIDKAERTTAEKVLNTILKQTDKDGSYTEYKTKKHTIYLMFL